MQLPDVLIEHIKGFLLVPPHPLQKEMISWNRKKYFYKWYFDKHSMTKKQNSIERFIHDNDFWIKMSGLNNENAVKLKHKCNLDRSRMRLKLKELNIQIYEVSKTTHIPRLNQHGNYSEVYLKNQEIVY